MQEPRRRRASPSTEDTLAGKRFAQGTTPGEREPRRVAETETETPAPAALAETPAAPTPPAAPAPTRPARVTGAAVHPVHAARRVAVGAFVGLLGLIGAFVVLGPRSAGGSVSGTSDTSVLSVRRVPVALGGVVADRQLSSEVKALLSDPAVASDLASVCLVVRVNGRRIVNVNPDTPLVPASNMKVLTGLAALARLGDSPLRTVVRSAQPAGGVVNGDVYLVGGGDPFLAVADYADKYAAARAEAPRTYSSLETLADAVAAKGVRFVTGSIVGDESRYDSVRFGPTWKSSYATLGEVGPQSALSVNHGFSVYFPTVVAAESPPQNAAEVFARLLNERGVAILGPARAGTTPAGTVELASLDSFPMAQLVGEMMRHSDNLAAELLLKEMGARTTAQQGTTAAGVASMLDALSALGLDRNAIATVDGSGLDRSDRATCGVLAAAVETGGRGSALDAAMPVAGVSGTLEDRFLGNPAQGRLRAKTGSLSGVSALTGFVDAVSGVPITFSFISNATPSDEAGKAFQERLGAVLANAPAPVDLSALAPSP